MTHIRSPRRLVAAVTIASAAAAFGLVAMPHAEAAPVEPVSSVAVDEGEWACLALDGVDLGTCLDNPLPDLTEIGTVPQILDDLLGTAGL